jgi:hypothetical protein
LSLPLAFEKMKWCPFSPGEQIFLIFRGNLSPSPKSGLSTEVGATPHPTRDGKKGKSFALSSKMRGSTLQWKGAICSSMTMFVTSMEFERNALIIKRLPEQ